jgi:hypothetical protein
VLFAGRVFSVGAADIVLIELVLSQGDWSSGISSGEWVDLNE